MIMVFVFPLLGLGALEIVDWATARLNLGRAPLGLAMQQPQPPSRSWAYRRW